MDEQQSTPLDPIAAQADRLEKALAELEARKQAAAEMAAKSTPHLERLTALQARLEALPQNERREVLDAIGLQKVSAAPKPITPLRGGGFVGRPAPQRQPARWALWLIIPRVELWQAVLLSLGIEPDGSLKAEACGRVPDGPQSINRLSREFFSRREDCVRALSTDGPIRPQGPLYSGILQSPRCPVLLAEVAVFLAKVGASVPAEMQAVQAEAKPQTETKEQRQDRRLKLCEENSLSFSGLKFDREGKLQGRLPDGIGTVATTEGVTRQTFTDDVKDALERRHARSREGLR
jgi:hypothetical protein